MRVERILVLSGTSEARALASALVVAGHDVTTSLAGATQKPILPDGKVRVGGFGGVEGLREFLKQEKISVVIDATHPFAAVISTHAARACGGLPLLRLERPAWQRQAGDQWIEVSDSAGALAALPLKAATMLTIGRKQVEPFFMRNDLSGLARMIEQPATLVPEGWTLILERPPFTVESELALMRQHSITHLVSKNAGGTETRAKLEAARQLRIPVVMIARPAKPVVPVCDSVAACVAAVRGEVV
jgi:precorrin-6A/cobalt-precorrin-6A reductase